MWRRFFGKPSEADLAEELDAHLAIEIKELVDRGVPREQAELEARRQLGSRARILEDTREARGAATLGRFAQDLRYATRVLHRGPAFTIAAVLSLALGIAAATSVFSIYDTIFLRPLPYKDPGQLAWVSLHSPSMGIDIVPGPTYSAWRRDNKSFLGLAATQVNFSNNMILSGPEPAEVHVSRVSANFLDTFGITPAMGRGFHADEEFAGLTRAVMLTDHIWRSQFDARRDVLGQSLVLDGAPSIVVGVLPKSFLYPVDVKVDILMVLNIPPNVSLRDRNVIALSVFGRLRPGVTIAQARADLGTTLDTAKQDFPAFFRGNTMVLEPLREHRTGNAGKFLFVLMAAAACLLAIACASVANLLLARWAARTRELAVRAAIGAGRGRLARQLFAEVALLIAGATTVAMVFVTLALRGFVHFAGSDVPRLGEVTTDFRVFGIAVLVALLTAIGFGALPALRAGRIDPQSVLGSGRGASSGGHRFLRRMLVTLEVALSVVLLSCAALLFETLWHMQKDHLGFQPEHVLTVTVPLRGKGFDQATRMTLADSILATLRRIPGTEAASLTDCSPINRGVKSFTFSRSDRPIPESFGLTRTLGACGSDPGYLTTAGIRIVQGRFLSDDDRHYPGTMAVLNEAAARAYFPGETAVGKQILGGRAGGWKTVVGVVGDTKNQGLNHPASPEVFLNDQAQSGFADLNFLVRTIAAEGPVARALRDEVRASNPGLLTKVETLDEAMNELTASPRFDTVLLAAFASIACLMAIVGVYGVLAFSVAQRRAEIGIRMALGASPASVLGLVMREGAALVILGVTAGLGVSLFLARYLASLLYGVRPSDPATYAAVVVTLSIAAAAASFLPARKAAVVDPVIALRHE